MASEDGVAEKVEHLGGFERLIDLCRIDRERNYSDGVLIASLVSSISSKLNLPKKSIKC